MESRAGDMRAPGLQAEWAGCWGSKASHIEQQRRLQHVQPNLWAQCACVLFPTHQLTCACCVGSMGSRGGKGKLSYELPERRGSKRQKMRASQFVHRPDALYASSANGVFCSKQAISLTRSTHKQPGMGAQSLKPARPPLACSILIV